FAIRGYSVFESKSTSLGPVLVGILLFCGCDWSPTRLAVSGNVTLQKAPLKNGTITFYPVSAGTRAGAVISNGKYENARQTGLNQGVSRVRTARPEGKTPADASAAPGPSGNFASKDRIPAEFNLKSKLEIEVTSAGPNQFDFTIP